MVKKGISAGVVYSIPADLRKAFHREWTAKFDGKDYPLLGHTDIDADTIAIKRIDANTSTEVFKKAGREIMSTRVVLSKNGKTLTRNLRRKNPQGQVVTSTNVFDKQ
jgi:hypothetical protein